MATKPACGGKGGCNLLTSRANNCFRASRWTRISATKKPCIIGMRYPVKFLLEYLAAGDSFENVLTEFPDLKRKDLLACLEFAARSLPLLRHHSNAATTGKRRTFPPFVNGPEPEQPCSRGCFRPHSGRKNLSVG